MMGEISMEKGFWEEQTNKKWGLFFFWDDILKDCLTYKDKYRSQDVKMNSI